MNIILLGIGSIGTRHWNNLRYMRPAVKVITADPKLITDRAAGMYADWRMAIDENQDAAGVIIASPTECHGEQFDTAGVHGLPCYVEKPLMGLAEWTPRTREALLHFEPGLRSAVGFQYRFNVRRELVDHWQFHGEMRFEARDNLIERYGKTVLETMGSHALDLALMVLGPAKGVALFTDGRYLKGQVDHQHGVSTYDMRMDMGTRYSTINGVPNNINNLVYLNALMAWLRWVETGYRDERTATLRDGAAVMDVMAGAKVIDEQPISKQEN